MAKYTIQGIQDRQKELNSMKSMFASFGPEAYKNPMSTFINPDTIGKAQKELDDYTAGYNAQVKAEQDRIKAQQEAEQKQLQAQAAEAKAQQERFEEYGVTSAEEVAGIIENRRRQAEIDKASSMAVRLTSRGTRGRRGTSVAPGRGRGFFDRYFA